MSAFKMEHLIEAVRARPQLYRKDHELYTDLESKHQAWREIAADVYPKWQSIPRAETYELVLLLQKKWRSLRDAFNRELRLMARGGPRSRKRYLYYKHLKFLKGEDDGQNSKESSDDDNDDPLQESRPRPRPKRRHRIAKRRSIKSEIHQDEEMETVAIDDEEEYHPNEESTAIFAETDQQDSDRLFLLSYAEEMRRLPAHVRMWARTQISKVMQEAVAYCCTEEHGGGGAGGSGSGGVCAAPAPSGLSDVLDSTERDIHTTKTTSN